MNSSVTGPSFFCFGLVRLGGAPADRRNRRWRWRPGRWQRGLLRRDMAGFQASSCSWWARYAPLDAGASVLDSDAAKRCRELYAPAVRIAFVTYCRAAAGQASPAGSLAGSARRAGRGIASAWRSSAGASRRVDRAAPGLLRELFAGRVGRPRECAGSAAWDSRARAAAGSGAASTSSRSAPRTTSVTPCSASSTTTASW